MKPIRFLSICLAIALVIALFPATVFAQTRGNTALAVTITHISLDPANDALGFKAKVEGALASVTEIGFCFRVNGGAEKVFTLAKTPTDGVFTARVKNILAAGGGEATLEAYAFVRMGNETVKSAVQATSMKQTLQTLDALWYTAGYTQAQKDAVKALCEDFKAQVEPWLLHNIFGINPEPTTFFGTTGDYQTTEHLDLSADTGANTGTVTVSENGVAFGYIRDFREDSFYFETKFHVNGILETENWPKFGLFAEAGKTREYFYVDMTRELTASVVGRMTNTDGVDDWVHTKTVHLDGLAFAGEGESITLGMLKQGKRLHLFVNGAYALSTVCGFADRAMAGIFSFNTGLTLTEYYTTSDVDAKLALIPEGELSKGDMFGYAHGDGVTYGTSGEVDLSLDKGEAPSMRIYGSAPRYAYLNDIYSDQFVFETQINVQSVLNNDGWPKFGIMVNGASEMVKFFVDMTPQMTATHVGVVYQPTGGGDDWANSVSREVPGMSFTGSDTVTLKLVRQGRAYYFFVNDVLVLQNDYGFRNERGAVGIFSFNTELTASNYTACAGVAAQDAIADATALNLSCNWFTDNQDGTYTLTTDSDAQHKVDDLTQAGASLRKRFYSVSGKLTLTDAADWGQARILISADPSNEYFVALEKLPSGNYQVFSMSKAGQDIWDDWQLIADEYINGTRNSIDFELLVMDGQLQLLIDGQPVYTSSRVSMTESTVKFTGFNVGTTTVGALSARVFETREEAERYLVEKTLSQENHAITYKNQLHTEGADPSALYITEGAEAGNYYMYVTSDALGCQGFLAFRSRDLVNWECVGTALVQEETYDEATGYTTVSYLTHNYWAPEVIYDSATNLYYMFYSAFRTVEDVTYGYGDIAVSDSPAGPFVSYNKYLGNAPVVIDEENKLQAYAPVFDFTNMDPNHPLYETGNDGYMKVIDLSPFADPVTGKKYVYFCHDVATELGVKSSGIYAMELHADYTPDYTKVYDLFTADSTLEEGKVNEAPFMLYNAQSGKYYLLYSANGYYQAKYGVRVAVGDTPVGPFTKLTKAEGGYLLDSTEFAWVDGTGHCSVVNRDGQDYIVYHAHNGKTEDNALIRGIAMDELHWAENTNGLLVPVVNGPSGADMPLTSGDYQNIAESATISATGVTEGSLDVLTDGMIIHGDDVVCDGATLTLQFAEAQTACAVMVYGGQGSAFAEVSSVRLQLKGGVSISYTGNDLQYLQETMEDGTVIFGSSACLRLIDLPITAIEITMAAPCTISEIVVMSKR